MGVIAWKKCDDQELVFITLHCVKQACAGWHLLRFEKKLFCFHFSTICSLVITRVVYYSLFHVELEVALCLLSKLTTVSTRSSVVWNCATPELTSITYSFLLQNMMWVNYQHPPSSLFVFSLLSHCRRCPWLGRPVLDSDTVWITFNY